jgi:hypothetical protein
MDSLSSPWVDCVRPTLASTMSSNQNNRGLETIPFQIVNQISKNQFTTEYLYRCDGGTIVFNGKSLPQNRPDNMPLTKLSAMSFADTLTLLPSLTSVQVPLQFLSFATFCESVHANR